MVLGHEEALALFKQAVSNPKGTKADPTVVSTLERLHGVLQQREGHTLANAICFDTDLHSLVVDATGAYVQLRDAGRDALHKLTLVISSAIALQAKHSSSLEADLCSFFVSMCRKLDPLVALTGVNHPYAVIFVRAARCIGKCL